MWTNKICMDPCVLCGVGVCRDVFVWLFKKQPHLKEALQFTGSFSSPAKQFSEPGKKKKTNSSSAGSGAFFITNSNHGYSCCCCGQTPRWPLFNLVFPFTSQVINHVLKHSHLEHTSILTRFLSTDESSCS